MVSLTNQKPLLMAEASFHETSRYEELLIFGCKAICSLLSKETDTKVTLKIAEMFIYMKSKRARELLAKGLDEVFATETTSVVVKLNTLKKGMADVDYDYEKILQGIAQAQELRIEEEQLVLVFCVLSLVTHKEYSVREYALHAL